MANRPQPYRLKWPLTPHQMEAVDEMFEILFKEFNKLKKDVEDTLANTIAISKARGPQGFPGSDGLDGVDGDRGMQGLVGPGGIPGLMGPPGDPGEDADTAFPQGQTLTGTLPTAFGGTGKNSWTAGSVAFAGTNVLTEDNANLFWDDTNNRLGVGTATPGTGTDGDGVAYSGYGVAKIHGVGGMFLLVPSSAGGAQGLMIDPQNMANGSNAVLVQAPSTWTGQLFSGNRGGTNKFSVTEAGNTTVAGTLAVTGVSTFGAPARLKGYTVATLPAGVVGYVAYCTDLLAPAFLAIAVGGGAVVGIVFYNGANWVTV